MFTEISYLIPTKYTPDEDKQLDFMNIRCLGKSKMELILQNRKSKKILCRELFYDAQRLVFVTEVLHSKLFKICISESNEEGYNEIGMKIFLNHDYLKEYINKSPALSIYLANHFRDKSEFVIETDIGSYLLDPDISSSPSHENALNKILENPNISWFAYQKELIRHLFRFEDKNESFDLNISVAVRGFHSNTPILIYEPVLGQMSMNQQFKMKMKSKGFIIADEMGLGKTLCCLSLLDSTPERHNTEPTQNEIEIRTKATLIIVPSHLVKQWESEVERLYKKGKKIVKVFTKTHHQSLTYFDFIEADVILTTQQFILNLKYYANLVNIKNEKDLVPLSRLNSRYHSKHHKIQVKAKLEDLVELPYENWKKETYQPFFEHFSFRRIVVDEAHEIYSMKMEIISQAKYFQSWLNSILTEQKYFISGTPLINTESIFNIIKFLEVQFIVNNEYIEMSPFLESVLSKYYIMSQILSNLMIRRRKTDVMDQISIPRKRENILWIDFTELERKIYDSKKRNFHGSDERRIANLQQICCHILVSSTDKKRFNSLKDINLFEMKEELIRSHTETIQKYTKKKNTLNSINTSYHMLKKMCENKISESTYMLSILAKLSGEFQQNELDECVICMDVPTDPVMLSCGHYFCNSCFQTYMNTTSNQKRCPTCKKKIESNEEIFHLKSKEQELESLENIDYVVSKYGSKLGNIIFLVNSLLLSNDHEKVIIFSQFDIMLRLIQSALAENKIVSSIVKGNVYHRQNSISQFKSESKDDNKSRVLLLSLTHAASGTNLCEGNNIIFVEPIYGDCKEEIQSIENQAVGRSHRIGQSREVNIYKFFTKNTIEEEIYNKIN